MAMDRQVSSCHLGQGAFSTPAQRILTKQRMELPSNSNGEVDWNTLGKILTAHILGEVLCGSYVDYKYGQRTPEFDADTDWEYAYEEKGIVVLKKQLPDSPIHCFMGRGVIDLPMDEVASFIVLPETAFLYDKYNVETRFIEVLSDTNDGKDIIIYRKYEAKQCLVKTVRDFVFYMRSVYMNGKYIQTVTSVDYDKCPPVPGVTRGEFCPGSGWVLEPYNGDETKTLVTYLAHADFSNLPPVITNRVLRRQPLCIHYVRQHLMNKVARNSDTHTGMNQSSDSHCHNWSERLYEDPLPVVAFITRRQTPSITHEEKCARSNRKPGVRRTSSLPLLNKLVESQSNQQLAPHPYLLQSNEEVLSMSRSYNMTQSHPPLWPAEQSAVGYARQNPSTFLVGDKHQNEPTGGKAPACVRGEQLPDTSDQKT